MLDTKLMASTFKYDHELAAKVRSILDSEPCVRTCGRAASVHDASTDGTYDRVCIEFDGGSEERRYFPLQGLRGSELFEEALRSGIRRTVEALEWRNLSA